MAISIFHTKVVTRPNNPAYQVSRNAWNDAHSITLSAGTLLGNSTGSPGAEEITPQAPLKLDTAQLQLSISAPLEVSGGDLTIDVGDGLGVTSGALVNTAKSVLLQEVYFETGTVASGTGTIPVDNTIPQITEGDQYMSLSITPKSATSNLEVSVVLSGSVYVATGTNGIVAVFRDSDADAHNVAWTGAGGSNTQGTLFTINSTHVEASGSTSTTTFKVRAGTQSTTPGTFTMNGFNGAALFGGAMKSSIIIREWEP